MFIGAPSADEVELRKELPQALPGLRANAKGNGLAVEGSVRLTDELVGDVLEGQPGRQLSERVFAGRKKRHGVRVLRKRYCQEGRRLSSGVD